MLFQEQCSYSKHFNYYINMCNHVTDPQANYYINICNSFVTIRSRDLFKNIMFALTSLRASSLAISSSSSEGSLSFFPCNSTGSEAFTSSSVGFGSWARNKARSSLFSSLSVGRASATTLCVENFWFHKWNYVTTKNSQQKKVQVWFLFFWCSI